MGNGAMVEIDSTVATHFLHVAQGQIDWREVAVGGLVVAGVIVVVVQPETAPVVGPAVVSGMCKSSGSC